MLHTNHDGWKLVLAIAITAGLSLSIVLGQTADGAEETKAGLAPKQQYPSEQPMPTDGPRIEFASPTFDFGKVIGGKPVHYEFLFTNTGSQTLEIKNVMTSCGCTTTGQWDRTVEPGKTGKIPIELKTDRINGEVKKSVRVTSNAPDEGPITLWIMGTIWQPIDIQPSYASLGPITNNDQPSRKTIKIINRLEEPLEIKKIESSNPLFRTDLKTISPGKEFELEVAAMPPFKPGSQWGTIKLETSSQENPEITITASYYVAAQVQFTPSRLLLPDTPLANRIERSVFVIHNAPSPLKITDVTVDVENVTTRIVEMKEGKQFRIILSFPAGFTLQNEEKAKLTFKTDDPSAPTVDVPITRIPARTTKSIPETTKPEGSTSP